MEYQVETSDEAEAELDEAEAELDAAYLCFSQRSPDAAVR